MPDRIRTLLQRERGSEPGKRYRDPRDKVYGSARWKRCRAWQLRRFPLCADPYGRHKRPTVGCDVDHRIPWKHNPATLMWEPSNWQTLCKSCHSKKSRTTG